MTVVDADELKTAKVDGSTGHVSSSVDEFGTSESKIVEFVSDLKNKDKNI
jgi:hypothetical protein